MNARQAEHLRRRDASPRPVARMRSVVAALTALLLSFAVSTSPRAQDFHGGVDVPAELGGADYLPHQIVHYALGAYSLELALPEGANIAALDLRPDGSWVIAPAHPVTLGGTDYEPHDLVATDGVTYALLFDGSAAGIPDGVRIDAVWIDPAGRLVLSFDVPVELGGTLYDPPDLVLHDGGFSGYWDAGLFGVPAYANVVGMAQDGAGVLVLTFDVPTELDGTLYEPGTLVEWDGVGFGARFEDPGWPPYAQLRGLSLGPLAGAVPDGGNVPGKPLELAKAGGGDITLRWEDSCSPNDSDYAVYEGTIGDFDGHSAKLCSTGGASEVTLTPAPRSSYYLVVPQNARSEGSYGTDSSGVERSQGLTVCLPQETGACQ